MVTKNELQPENRFLTYEQMNIIINTQRLWQTLAFIERSLMFSVFRDTERIPTVANRLYNSVIPGFYNLFRYYYGRVIAQQFTNYLSDYITNLWRLTEAVASNNTEGVNTYTVGIYQAADQLASYLSTINLYWSEEQWKNLLYQHTAAKIQEILAIASKDFEREYDLFEQVAEYSALMGDYMARGLIARSATPAPPQS